MRRQPKRRRIAFQAVMDSGVTIVTLLGMPFALASLMTWIALIENPQHEFLRDDGSWVLESVLAVFGSWLVASLLFVLAIWSLWKICVKRFR